MTLAGYGCHIHGDESGSVDRMRNLPGSRMIEADPKRVFLERRLMEQPSYCMDKSRREAVLAGVAGAVDGVILPSQRTN
jgi:hypothetical protein